MKEFDYLQFLKSIDIQSGDILDVTADLMSIMVYCRENKLKFKADNLIDCLIDAVGQDGTLLIRTFNWDFCKGIPFNIKSSPSQVGSLGNLALKRPDFTRTQHPLYSWMVWGKDMRELAANNESKSFGDGTIFDYLYKKSAKLVRLGNTQVSGFTQTHHAEEIARVPYRFEKTFRAKYIDESGTTSEREYSMYVRYLDYDIESDIFPKTYDEWKEEGIISETYWDWLKISVIDIKRGVDYMVEDLQNNYGKKMCKINNTIGYEYALKHPPVLQ